MNMSKKIQDYFAELMEKNDQAYERAVAARKKGHDPETVVEISLAKNMAERVVGLISVVAPQIANSGVVERIIKLEKQYGALDWRVALIISLEIAQEKFCKFKDKKEAAEVGIRTGFAYSTVGVVSSPLDGMVNLEIKPRRDGTGEFFCINYAGPIRNAGGTNAALSVIIADYVRKKLGYSAYDPEEIEIKRFITEIRDYDERISPRQHRPSEEELRALFKNLPVEVGAEPSEKIEVSNYKDLPRITTNLIRSGFCLMNTDCIPLKAPKLWRALSKWGKEFDMEHWNFLCEVIELQKKAKASKKIETAGKSKIQPSNSFIADLVAGRPVIGHPMAKGAFRLRYGRSRTSGYSAQSIHPATMHVLDDYIAFGTQLKIERPGKGTVFSACDTIEGPIVKLDDDSVIYIGSESEAKQYKKRVKEILFVGDVLINYGDFFNRAHILAPAGYCEEWWVQELEKAIVSTFGSIDTYKLQELTDIDEKILKALLSDFFNQRPTAKQAIALSEKLRIPLHPHYTLHWSDIDIEQFRHLVEWLSSMKIMYDENSINKIIIKEDLTAKRILELLGLPHFIATEFIVIQKDFAEAFAASLNLSGKTDFAELKKIINDNNGLSILEIINKISKITLRDKSGTYIGGRMGRPEKAKMRMLTGSPHVLFPVGEEGGKMRSFQSAIEKKKVTADFPLYACDDCNNETVFSICELCNKQTRRMFYCQYCMKEVPERFCRKHGRPASFSKNRSIDIRKFIDIFCKRIGMTVYPDLVKGVRGTSNAEHVPEHLIKGLLRAKHGVYVNKDGTIRYDCTEMPCTHFKPGEIRTSVAKLRELGYTEDICGASLTDETQILELKPQDVILPGLRGAPNEPSDDVLFRIANFIDDLLVRFYDLPPFYILKLKEDLVGHLIISLAPHTSAGILGRIIGFSQTQTFMAHPLFHAANRRDCDGDEIGFILLMDAFLNFSKKFLPASRGSTMDAPLVLTAVLAPAEVDDMAFDVDIVDKYPLEFYEAALNYKMPWDVQIRQIKAVLNTPAQYEGMMFTHDTSNFNCGVLCSAYKTLPSMEEKLKGQMDIAEKVRAVDASDVARLVIEKHLIRDTKGNLRKFSMQQFRCVNCNEKFRRPPLIGKCTKCSGRLIFTISEGSIVKYLEPSISLAAKYNVSDYLKQSLELVKRRVEEVFGKEAERQEGLGKWFG